MKIDRARERQREQILEKERNTETLLDRLTQEIYRKTVRRNFTAEI